MCGVQQISPVHDDESHPKSSNEVNRSQHRKLYVALLAAQVIRFRTRSCEWSRHLSRLPSSSCTISTFKLDA